MEVKEHKAYHIHRLGKYDECWKIGEELQFGDIDTNPDKKANDSKSDTEVAFEKIRNEHFKALPSRDKCLFVCNNENRVLWYNYLTKQKDSSSLCLVEIFEVELTGNIFRADASLYEGFWQDKNVDTIMSYWNGVIKNEDRIEELFAGHVKVVTKISPESIGIKITKKYKGSKILTKTTVPKYDDLNDIFTQDEK